MLRAGQELLPELDERPVHRIERVDGRGENGELGDLVGRFGKRLVSVSEGFEETPSGRLVEGIMATIAEFYSDNLGHEVRKGMQQKLKNGGWPHLAAPGYVNIRVNTDRKAEAIVVVDREQGPLAVQAFELFATGEQTLNSLHVETTTRGLRNKYGRPLSRSKLAEMSSTSGSSCTTEWSIRAHTTR